MLMTLGENLRERRRSCGLTQEKVAELVGVSRQAVTKWETGQSLPTAENLIKLAELFGTTLERLLPTPPPPSEAAAASGERAVSPLPEAAAAQQLCDLFRREQAQMAAERSARRRKNLTAALAAAGGYLVLYLLCRIFNGGWENTSVIGWLFSTPPGRLSYLFGWLLTSRMYWIAAGVSVLPALWGRWRYAFSTLGGFGLGLLVGELLGPYPSGAPYGHGHYGWAIWGGIFLFSVAMGVVAEKLAKDGRRPSPRAVWIWFALFLAGAAAISLVIRLNLPVFSGS